MTDLQEALSAIVYEFGYERGDLIEQYARDQMVRRLEAVLADHDARVRSEARAEVVAAVEARLAEWDAANAACDVPQTLSIPHVSESVRAVLEGRDPDYIRAAFGDEATT